MTDFILPPTISKNFNRNEFPGKSNIEGVQHELLKDGAMLERNIGDAVMWVKDGIKDLEDKVKAWVRLQLASASAEPSIAGRIIACIIAIVTFVKDMIDFIKDVIGLIQAVVAIIGFMQGMIASIIAMAQRILNAIATLINEICSLQLPKLPSIPNLFGNLYFDGFKFPKGAFKFALHFDANFAFGACHRRQIQPSIFQNYPSPVKFGMDPSGTFQESPSVTGNPPLPNALFVGDVNPAGSTLPNPPDPALQPIFADDWTPDGGFTGALPVPTAIKAPYALTPDLFGAQILSLLPGSGPITVDENPVGTTGPGGGTTTSVYCPPLAVGDWEDLLQPAVRAFCVQEVTLDKIIPADWDVWGQNQGGSGDFTQPLNWVVAWAWLAYVYQCRENTGNGNVFGLSLNNGRGGTWLPAFQDVYTAHVLPGYQDIVASPVPWNAAMQGLIKADGTMDTTGVPPWSMVFIQHLMGMVNDPAKLYQTLWKLSYVEASLLGYPRCTRWDAMAGPVAAYTPVAGFIDGPTGADLDYVPLPTTGSAQADVTVLLDSMGKANYPSSITIPQALAVNMAQVVAWGVAEIAATPGFLAPSMANRVVYNEYAQPIQINFYSQYWKQFRANWLALLAYPQPSSDMPWKPSLQSIIYNYPALLDSAVNPLTKNPGLWPAAKLDYENRYWGPTLPKAWTSGSPYLPTPVIPTVVITASSAGHIYILGQGQNNGWGGVADGTSQHNMADTGSSPTPVDPKQFDPQTFLARPDIQALPYNYQQQMLYLNQAYADTAQNYDAIIDAITAQAQSAFDVAEAALGTAMQYLDAADAATAQANADIAAALVYRQNLNQPVIVGDPNQPTITFKTGDTGQILLTCVANGVASKANVAVGIMPLRCGPDPANPLNGPRITFSHPGALHVTPWYTTANTSGYTATADGPGPFYWTIQDATTAALTALQPGLASPGPKGADGSSTTDSRNTLKNINLGSRPPQVQRPWES